MSRADGQRTQRTATIGDADLENSTVREVRGLSLGLGGGDEPELPGSKPRGRSDSIVEAVDSEGNTYYYNKYTAKVGWHPEEVTRNARAELTMEGGDGGRSRMESVQSQIDPASGKEYFFNTHTQKTGWSADGLSRKAVDDSYGIGIAGGREGDGGGFVLSNPMFEQKRQKQKQKVSTKAGRNAESPTIGKGKEEKQNGTGQKDKGQKDRDSVPGSPFVKKKKGTRRTWAPIKGVGDAAAPSLPQQQQQQQAERERTISSLVSIKSSIQML
jgi:hypothetical protein